MSIPTCTAVLIGFNPVELARDVPVEGWDKRCAEVFQELARRSREGDPRCHVLNPVVGPEAVTGSSRMKGGSMTKILLDTVFFKCITNAIATADDAATSDADSNSVDVSSVDSLRDLITAYERAYREAYADVGGIARLTELAGAALRSGRAHLYYVGPGVAGMVGMIDASEMVDTFVLPSFSDALHG